MTTYRVEYRLTFNGENEGPVFDTREALDAYVMSEVRKGAVAEAFAVQHRSVRLSDWVGTTYSARETRERVEATSSAIVRDGIATAPVYTQDGQPMGMRYVGPHYCTPRCIGNHHELA